jgi:phospholipid/cholesterol/gamma-HCH transport system ATP-binding protein
VLVSHEIPDVFYISQRIAMIDEGRIVFAGTPEELKQCAVPAVRQFVDAASFDRDLSEKHNSSAGVEVS